jgi:hypothetical protein
MRLPLLSPSHLSPQQQKRSGDMRQGTESNFKGFQAISDGALIGPWKRASEVVMPREGRRVQTPSGRRVCMPGTWNPWKRASEVVMPRS